MTTLADLIETERPRILAAWEAHARTLRSGAAGELVLLDHVTELLDAIVADMRGPQSQSQRAEKSKGHGAAGPLDLLSGLHAEERGERGYRLSQIVSEYRALRASVLALWEEAGGERSGGGVGRFNEAIDQVIAAAVERFTTTADHYHDQSLGILGHDLRSPLTSVIAGATLLAGDTLTEAQRHDIAGRVVASAKRMNRMVADLLDLTRIRFGDAIPVVRTEVDLEPLLEQVIAEHVPAHRAGVRLATRGDLHGEWDSDRIAQVVANLVRNAIEHGAVEAPITVNAESRDDDVVITVQNSGPAIPRDTLTTLFDPDKRPHDGSSKEGLGLGLYIAWHVVEAHGGDIRVESTDADGTRFFVRLPRRPRVFPRADRTSSAHRDRATP